MNIYALYVEGRFIKAVNGLEDAMEMFYRFLSGIYYRMFINSPDNHMSFQWLTMYRVRMFRRNMDSLSFLPMYIGEAELRYIQFIHNREPQSQLENEEHPSSQLPDNVP